jgi:peptidoglycan/xylan/chitin deacetylase (PgdA/CDA1 family)
MELGNHSNDHRDLDHAETRLWLDDVSRCDATLRTLTGKPGRYFRYPFLRQGATVERRDAAAALLARLGLEVAHVTVDNSDWRLARWYGDAIEKKDTRRQGEIAAAYLDHMTAAVRHFQDVARAKVGRDVSHILLLHANQLAADHLGDVLDALRADGFTFITLEEALRDPVYRMKDAYLGPWGCSWLDRIAPPDLEQKWIDDQDRALADRFEPRESR